MGGNTVYTFTAAELRSQGYTPEHAAAVEARGGYIGKPPRSPQPPPQIRQIAAGNATVRAWAKAHDIPVPARGRIPAAVMAQFVTANGEGTPGNG